MIFSPTKLQGAFIIDIEHREDDRGFFARSWCQDEFAAHGLNPRLVQCNVSFNRKRGTLRGLHLQVTPYAEAKLVRCTRGRLYDVAVDLRKDSATFRQWVAVELSAENRRMLYVPEGMAHGFETLEDETEVFYQMSEFHHPEAARGVRWNDAALGIAWPLVPPVLSDKDRAYPDLASWPNSS